MTKRHRGRRKKSSNEVKSFNSDGEIDKECKRRLEDLLDRYASRVLGESDNGKVEDEDQEKRARRDSASNEVKETEYKKPKKEVEVVVFNSRKKDRMAAEKREDQHQKHTNSKHGIPKSKWTDERLNSAEVLKKLQFDVGSFGMKAFSKEKQRDQERQRAIKLGAKPPKRQHTNYKVFMEERKKQKLEATESYEESLALSTAKSRNISKTKFRKDKSRAHFSQIGKYKDGVLKLSSKDIKAVTKRR